MTATAQHPTGARDSLTGLLDRTLPPDDLARIETVLQPYRIEHDLAAVLTGCTTLIHVEPDDGPPQTPHKAVAPGGKRPR